VDWLDDLLGAFGEVGSESRRRGRGDGVRSACAALLVAVGLLTIAVLVLAGA
jgi:hypothetical protein